jgi:hypothetical protein
VRAVFVVVPDVDPQDPLEWPRPTISNQSRHSARTVRTHRSAYAFAKALYTDATCSAASSMSPGELQECVCAPFSPRGRAAGGLVPASVDVDVRTARNFPTLGLGVQPEVLVTHSQEGAPAAS